MLNGKRHLLVKTPNGAGSGKKVLPFLLLKLKNVQTKIVVILKLKNCIPINKTSEEDHDNQYNKEEAEVYLDYAGASLPSLSQLRAMYIYQCSNSWQILANPHSTGPAASRTSTAIERMNMRVLKFFGALPGFRYGYGCGEEGIDNHRITGKTSLHAATNTDNKIPIEIVNKKNGNN